MSALALILWAVQSHWPTPFYSSRVSNSENKKNRTRTPIIRKTYLLTTVAHVKEIDSSVWHGWVFYGSLIETLEAADFVVFLKYRSLQCHTAYLRPQQQICTEASHKIYMV